MTTSSTKSLGQALEVHWSNQWLTCQRVKILGYHRNGMVLIYKILDKKKFTIKTNNAPVELMTEKQLSWLLAGLDWVSMSENPELLFEDYF